MRALAVIFSLIAMSSTGQHVVGVEDEAKAQFRDAVERSSFPASERDNVMRIADCESGGTYDPKLRGDWHTEELRRATDWVGSIGPMQINGGNLYGRNIHAALEWVHVNQHDRDAVRAWLEDLDNNLSAAYAIWEHTGSWREWTCARLLGIK